MPIDFQHLTKRYFLLFLRLFLQKQKKAIILNETGGSFFWRVEDIRTEEQKDKKRKQSKSTIDFIAYPLRVLPLYYKKEGEFKRHKNRRTKSTNVLLLLETPSRLWGLHCVSALLWKHKCFVVANDAMVPHRPSLKSGRVLKEKKTQAKQKHNWFIAYPPCGYPRFITKKRESFKTPYLARRSKREEDIATFISKEFLRVAGR